MEPFIVEHLSVAQRFPSLTSLGVAAEYFPRYVHLDAPGQHTHEHLELCLVLSGQVWTRIGVQELPLPPGSLSVINYNQSHDVFTGPDGAEVYNLYLDLRHCTFPILPEGLSSWLIPMFPLHPAFGQAFILGMGTKIHL